MPFVLQLQSATQSERIDGVTSVVGEDDSSTFGILMGRARLVTSLVFDWARFRTAEARGQFLALPGAV